MFIHVADKIVLSSGEVLELESPLSRVDTDTGDGHLKMNQLISLEKC